MITIELIGRLGNQMFQYALCRTIAERNGYNFYIPSGNNGHGQNLSDYFELNMGYNDNMLTGNHFSEDPSIQKYNPSIFQIPDGTSIRGFYQSEKYFLENENNVKSWFGVELDEITGDILKRFPIEQYCYIHFRGGDYKNWDSGTRFLPVTYFETAIKNILEFKSGLKFLIITDDIEEAKNYFPEFEIVSNPMIVDFKLLYFSKYCIIPNSTFSWWASWLSQKEITIAPDCWLNYNQKEKGFYPFDIKSSKFKYIN